MRMKLVTFILGVVAIVVLALVFVGDSTTHRFADGSLVVLEQVSFGKQHEFSRQPRWKRQLKELPLIGRLVPGQNFGSSRSSSSEESLRIWLTVRDRSGQFLNPKWERIEAVDVHGCAYPLEPLGGGSGSYYYTEGDLRAFPRTQSKFDLRCYLKGQDKPASFKITNPISGPFGSWEPQGIPVTVIKSNLSITLADLRLIVTNGRAGPVATFSFAEDENPTADWFARYVSFSDIRGHKGKVLCTNEHAWKVNAWVSKKTNAVFSSNQVWSVTKLPIPPPGDIVPVGSRSSWAGVTVGILWFAGPGTYMISNGVMASSSPLHGEGGMRMSSSMNDRGDRTLEVNSSIPVIFLDPVDMPSGDTLFMIRGRDNLANNFITSSRFGGREPRAYEINVSSNASSIDLDFIVQPTFRAEFTVSAPRN